MVAAVQLVERVVEHPVEHGQAVPHPAGRTREVDHQGPSGHPGQSPGEHGGGHLVGAFGPNGRGQPGDVVVQDHRGGLRGPVGRRDAGATRGDHQVRGGRTGTLPDPVTQRPDHVRTVGADDRPADGEPAGDEPLSDHRAGPVRVDAGGRPGRGDDHHRCPVGGHRSTGLVQVPVLPPSLRSTRTASNTAAGSTALIMSCRVSPATATAVNASISTPVRSVVRTVAEINTSAARTSRSTDTAERDSGWHSGTRSGVRLAAMIPAIRAVASASPFGRLPCCNNRTTSAVVRSTPVASAVLVVGCLPETSTIRAAPLASTWVSAGAGSGTAGGDCENWAPLTAAPTPWRRRPSGRAPSRPRRWRGQPPC